MASTQQGSLPEAPSVSASPDETRLSMPETTMFIVASSGALWALLFGLYNLITG
ncbi:MAG: hypothetical protein ACR2Q4_24285 [Geminicoccaceae bacterium]